MTYTPCAMTEWDEPLIMDCVWASGLMLANKATLGARPCTRTEREALARAAGLAEGHEAAAITDLERGMLARYGWTGTIYTGSWAGFISKLSQGWAAVLLGYYAALPPHFTRWDPGFASKGINSYHAMYFQRQPVGTLWEIDPLFHAAPDYKGELIAASYVQAYATAYGSPVVAMLIYEGSQVQAGPIVPAGEPMAIYERSNTPGSFVIESGSTVKGLRPNADGTDWEVVKTWSPQPSDSSASFDYLLHELAGGILPSVLIHVDSGFFDGLFVPTSQVTETVAPAPAADCSALQAELTAAASDLAAATARALDTAKVLRNQATLLGG